MARGDLAAHDGDARRGHRHHEGGAVAVAIHAGMRADVDVLRVGRRRVHADPAAQHQPRVRLPHDAQRGALGGVGAEAGPDGGRARREGEEPPRARDLVAVRGRGGGLRGRDVAPADHVVDAERDQVAVGRRVRDVARGLEQRGRAGAAHRAQVVRRPGHREGPRSPDASRVGRGQQPLLPRGVVVAVVPEGVLVHHRAGGGVHGDVLDQPLADHEHAAPVAERLAVLAPGPHGAIRASASPARRSAAWCARPRDATASSPGRTSR